MFPIQIALFMVFITLLSTQKQMQFVLKIDFKMEVLSAMVVFL